MTDGEEIAAKFAVAPGAAQTAPRRGFLERLRSEPLFPETGSGGAPLTAVIGVMSFLAVLALGAFMAIILAADAWTNDLRSGLTIQIKGPDAEAIRADTQAALAVLEATPGVEAVRALSLEETRALLEPWLGKGNAATYLNIPGLIEAEAGEGFDRNLGALRARLIEVAPGAEIDDHGAWHDQLSAAARSGQAVAFAVFLLVMAAACTIAMFAARAGLAANRDIVALLHLVGATDGFIASQVQRRFFVIGLRGALLGFVLALGILGGAALMMRPAGGFLPDLRFGWNGALILLSVPLALCLFTALTARLTVLRILAKEL